MTGPPDPLRLCVYATVAALTWLCGPVAVVFFAGLGLTGYVRARRHGLRRSACLLRDIRVIIVYLAVLLGAGLFATARAWWPG